MSLHDDNASEATSHWTATPDPVAPETSLRILVAEDNELNRALTEQLLLKRGHQVALASDGTAALRLLSLASYDLLLLDLHMPGLDGFGVVRAIREHEQHTGGHLPVIALTARAREQDRLRCLAEGMDGFVTKPIAAHDLWTTIQHYGKPRERALPTSLVDPSTLRAACDDDEHILSSVAQLLRTRLPAQIAELQDAAHAADSERVYQAAHKLSGTVSVFSPAFFAVTSQLELLAEEGPLDDIQALVTEVARMAGQLEDELITLSIETLRQRSG